MKTTKPEYEQEGFRPDFLEARPGETEVGVDLEYGQRRIGKIEQETADQLSSWEQQEQQLLEHAKSQIGLPEPVIEDMRREFNFDEQSADARTQLQKARDFATRSINRVTSMFKSGSAEKPVDFSRYQTGDFMKDREVVETGAESPEAVMEQAGQGRMRTFFSEVGHKIVEINKQIGEKVEDEARKLPIIGSARRIHDAVYGREYKTGRKMNGKERFALAGTSIAQLSVELLTRKGQAAQGFEGAAESTRTIGRLAQFCRTEKGERYAKAAGIFEALAKFMHTHDKDVRGVERHFQES